VAAEFPTSLHDFSATYADNTAQATTHPGIHNDLNEEVAAIQTKVGVDSSAVATSLDYLVKSTSSSNPGHKHTLANGATDVTASAAEVNIMDGVTADKDELNITDGGQTTEKVLNVQSKCKVYSATSQLNLTNATPTKVDLDTEEWDIGSDFDTANHRFTAPVTGYYLVCGHLAFLAPVDGMRYDAMVYVNGASASCFWNHAGGVSILGVTISSIEKVTSGQYIELYAQSNSGGNTVDILGGQTYTYLCIHLLSI
jgi:hypothetical protein